MGTIGHGFDGQVIGPQYQVLAQVDVELEWSSDDPYAVTAKFRQGEGEQVPWVFARSLMRAGLSSLRGVGLGDVRFRRQLAHIGGNLEIRLDSPEGVAVVQLPAPKVIAFIRETLRACPFGSEGATIGAQFDREVKELLG